MDINVITLQGYQDIPAAAYPGGMSNWTLRKIRKSTANHKTFIANGGKTPPKCSAVYAPGTKRGRAVKHNSLQALENSGIQ